MAGTNRSLTIDPRSGFCKSNSDLGNTMSISSFYVAAIRSMTIDSAKRIGVRDGLWQIPPTIDGCFRGLCLPAQSNRPVAERSKVGIFDHSNVLVSSCNRGILGFGNLVPNRGMLDARQEYHGHETSKLLLGLTSLFVVISCLSSFQINAMPVFDNLEIRYTGKIKKPCPRWLRAVFRSSLDAWHSLHPWHFLP
ncbi:hypothetical protein Peur_014467 [Populus x canadensis]